MKKQRTKKQKILWAAAAAGVLMLAALLSVRVREVRIQGSQYYSQEALEQQLFPGFWDRSPLVVWIRQKTGTHPEIPFVERYTVRLTGLTSVQVTVYEKSMMGYVEFSGSYLYFDKDGLIVESSQERYGTLPRITGLDFDYAVLGQTLPVKDPVVFTEIQQISQYLAEQEVDWGGESRKLGELMDQISFDGAGRITCCFGEIQVYLGTPESLEGKLREMKDILPKLYGRAGTLYLDTYQENQRDPSYIFK